MPAPRPAWTVLVLAAPRGPPLLLVDGTAGHPAEGAADLAERSGGAHAGIPVRDHAEAVSSPLLVRSAVDFLGG
ncbi:hypothetical protein [Nocardiopsis alborubida]|uniref:Alpha/beta hydrolase n=1 Tax=Nocardiopsis alborubida TaxID=146802 RepID=A0A7X6RU47_9ACTN|nr:hypothetical protein [Nocardiopsis alborubida]NKZ01982.1 hypothetical protein [Nocardiopsis alborubida]